MIPSYIPSLIKNKFVKIDGVKIFKMQIDDKFKKEFILDFYLFDETKTMIYENKKYDG